MVQQVQRHGNPHGRTGAPEAGAEAVVAAPHRNRGRHARRVGLDHHARVIGPVPHNAQVDHRHGYAVEPGQREHLLHPRALGRRSRRGVGDPVEDVGAAAQGGQVGHDRPEGAGAPEVSRRTAPLDHAPRVQGIPQGGTRHPGRAGLIQHRGHQRHGTHRDPRVGHAGGREGARKGRDHLGIGIGAGGAHQLDAGLALLCPLDLARGRGAHGTCVVGDAHRVRVVRHARCDQAGDGDGEVRPEDQHPALVVEQPVRASRGLVIGPPQDIRQFDERRHHLAVPEGAEGIRKGLPERPQLRRLHGQHVADPGWEERGIGHRVSRPPARCARPPPAGARRCARSPGRSARCCRWSWCRWPRARR